MHAKPMEPMFPSFDEMMEDDNEPSVPWASLSIRLLTGPKITLRHMGKMLAATDKAIRVNINGKNTWVPRSQIGYADNECVSVSMWWARKVGLAR